MTDLVDKCHLGGIGRRSGFKIHRPQGHPGSSPGGGTLMISLGKLYGIRFENDPQNNVKNLLISILEVLESDYYTAKKIKYDKILESELFQLKNKLKDYFCVQNRKVIPYISTNT